MKLTISFGHKGSDGIDGGVDVDDNVLVRANGFNLNNDRQLTLVDVDVER